MPIAPPRLCSKCGHVVSGGGKCPTCARRRAKEYNMHRRDKQTYDEVYNTTRWRLIRDLRLKASCGLCDMCRENGIIAKADVVDHIIEIKDGGEPFDLRNTQSLCHYHHNKKTAKERKKRGD